LLAVNFRWNVPNDLAVPLRTPVVPLREIPDGRVPPETLKDGCGVPDALTVNELKP
jgi:hypothetical protein